MEEGRGWGKGRGRRLWEGRDRGEEEVVGKGERRRL